MSGRRTFIKKATFSALSFPLVGVDASPESFGSLPGRVQNTQDDSYWEMIRKQFPLDENQVYFNNATMGPPSGYVLQRMLQHQHYYARQAAEVDYKNGSGWELISGYFQYENLRKKLAKIIRAHYKEVSLIQNATFGMNYIAMGLDLKEGDELLNTNLEHGGGYAAWQMLAKRKNCVYKQAKITIPANDPQQVFDAIFQEVTPKTRVIAIPHIVSVYGIVMPVKEICEEARKRGIFTVLDGAQSVGQIKVNVKEIGCDAYYTSLHKWLLAPAGNGLLYVDEDVVDQIWPTIASYNWKNEDDHGMRLMQNGTGNPALIEGCEAAVDFFNSIGEEKWTGRINELGDYLRESLSSLNQVTIHSSTNSKMCAGITTYSVAGLSGPQLQRKLWEEDRLQPRSIGSELLRHSVHIYNSREEIDRAITVIKGL